MQNINKELNKGYYVIIDTRLLTIEHIEQLHKAINDANLNNYIIWYS